MNYKVLYRKYRPTTFDEIVGQDNSIELLKDSIVKKKISHAYIFAGPRGTGKTSAAKVFAKAINCENNDSGNPCNNCQKCISFSQNSDIYEIDAASNNGVDQIREIIENIKLAPINSKYKVYIIDEVHMLSVSAFNALLLTLEEPPSHVVFILATTNIEDVPITVLSRCQRIDFKKISIKDISNNLKKVAKTEKINIDDDAIREIAEFAEGGMRDALSILDQLSKTNKKITQETVLNSIGMISVKKINDLILAIENNNRKHIINFIDNVRENAIDFKTLIKKIINSCKQQAINILETNERTRLGFKDYKELCFELAGLLYKSNINVDSYTLLEFCLLNYLDLENNNLNISREIEFEEAKFNNLNESSEKLPKIRLGNNFEKLCDVRINNCFVGANKKYLQTNKDLWEEFLNRLDNKKVKGMLLDSRLVLSSDSILVIKVDFFEKSELINENIEQIEKLFNKFSLNKYKLVAVTQERWTVETEKYKENIKNNISYKMLPEPMIVDNNNVVSEIFEQEKIEVK